MSQCCDLRKEENACIVSTSEGKEASSCITSSAVINLGLYNFVGLDIECILIRGANTVEVFKRTPSCLSYRYV